MDVALSAHNSDGLAPSAAKQAQSQYRRPTLNWEDHKALLKRLYLVKNKRLDVVMSTMAARSPPFVASIRQYKEMFSCWGWKKNLSRKQAAYMLQKGNERARNERKRTVFEYGGQMWNMERVERSARRAKTKDIVEVIETPPGVICYTPLDDETPPAAMQEQPQQMDVVSVSSDSRSASPEASQSNRLMVPRLMSISSIGLSAEQLDAMLDQAVTLDGNHAFDAAEQHYMKVLEGYSEVLGATHGATAKVALRLASFLAKQRRFSDAHSVIDISVDSHIRELGIGHTHAWQHVLHVVELLNSWDRTGDALAFLARTCDMVHSPDRQNGPHGGSFYDQACWNMRLLEAAYALQTDQSADCLDRSILAAKQLVTRRDAAVEALVQAILACCDEDDLRWAKQRLNGWAVRITLCNKIERHLEFYRAIIGSDRAFGWVLANYPWHEERLESLDVMEALLGLAAALQKAGAPEPALQKMSQAIGKALHWCGKGGKGTIPLLMTISKVCLRQCV